MWTNNESEAEIVNDLNQVDPTIDVYDESHHDSEDNSKNGEEDENTTSNKSKKPNNKSNFKRLAKQNKELKARLAEYEWSNDDDSDDDSDNNGETSSINEAKFVRYLLKNPDAVAMEEEIVETLNKFWNNMSYEEAFTFVKANNQTSQSHTDFSSKTKTIPKKLSTLTEEEALKHFKWNDAWYLDWQRKTGRVKF